MKINLKWMRNPADFLLLHEAGPNGYRVIIEDIYLDLSYVTVAPSIMSHHMGRYKGDGLSIHGFTKTDIRRYAFPQGITELHLNNCFANGLLPKQLYLFLVETSVMHGVATRNPLELLPYSMEYCNIVVNGVTMPPDSYRPDTSLHCVREYRALLHSLGLADRNLGNSLSMDLFNGGTCELANE